MTYIDYRHRVEFGEDEYHQIDEHAASAGIALVRLPVGRPSVAFLEKFDVADPQGRLRLA